MSKKLNNRTLLIIFIVLAGVLVLTEIFHKTEKNLKTELVAFNTNEVNEIQIYAKGKANKPIKISRVSNTEWNVSNGKEIYKAGADIVKSYFDELRKIKSQRLAANSKDKWDDFQVTDSTASRIKLFNAKNKPLLDILIGKFSYKQAANPYGRNNVRGISYVRLANEKEVYAVDGFLPMSLNRSFDDWRIKTLCKFNAKDIKSIDFSYPDSSFKLNLKDSLWFVGDLSANIKKVNDYLSGLQNKNGHKFNNNFKPTSNPIYQVKIEGDNLSNIEIKCYATPEKGKFIIHSNQNTEAYFESNETGLMKQIFKSLKDFMN